MYIRFYLAAEAATAHPSPSRAVLFQLRLLDFLYA